MKIIGLPDLHSYIQGIARIGAVLAAADVVLLVGDLTNGSLTDAQNLLQTVRQFNVQVLAVPGNMDADPINDYLLQEGVGIHRSYRMINNTAFVGVGGALPFAGSFVFDEKGLAQLLQDASKTLDAAIPQILVCHQPPLNTKNDQLGNGFHVGSSAVRAYIERQQPLICFTGHIHEATGIDTLGSTSIINPGSLRRGNYAYAKVEDGMIQVLDIRAV